MLDSFRTFRLNIVIRFAPCASVVLLTFLYIISEAVIPVPVFTGVNSSGNPVQKHWIPGQARNDKQSKPR